MKNHVPWIYSYPAPFVDSTPPPRPVSPTESRRQVEHKDLCRSRPQPHSNKRASRCREGGLRSGRPRRGHDARRREERMECPRLWESAGRVSGLIFNPLGLETGVLEGTKVHWTRQEFLFRTSLVFRLRSRLLVVRNHSTVEGQVESRNRVLWRREGESGSV